MEKDYRTASGKFWQTVWRLRRGKQLSANTVYSGGRELLASTGDIVGRWKEYFEDLLNPTDTPSVEEPEAEDSEVDSFITQAEVTEVVQQLLHGKAPGVDEIRPEYLKSLDVVGLSWLTRLCNIAWQSGTVPLDWATGVVVPLFKKGDRRGANSFGQLGLKNAEDQVKPQCAEYGQDAKTLRAITGGGGHSALITESGELLVCGQNRKGQLGLGHVSEVMTFQLCQLPVSRTVQQVSCGWDFTIILTGSGGVYQWGTGLLSQAKRVLNPQPVPDHLSSKEPCLVTGLDHVSAKSVSAGSAHCACLTGEISQEVQWLLCLLNQLGGVECPCEVLADVDPKGEVIVLTPCHKNGHLPPVGHFIPLQCPQKTSG
ncbi:hypothetical protein QTP70_005845 [Hemibagrus guttatus]|uniref:Uncharacterized protein n=1 Tax=Hemibagrus guttatus TaxID=175788 RepID=A0AAE0QNB6_9TELE|nr:hypothetical protein QTP70_005845 [Hemibagrus guttatus]